jgi:predicted amidohydrolase
MTADPHGTIICRANETEQLLFCDLDPSVTDEARRSFPFAKDRKDHVYEKLENKRES